MSFQIFGSGDLGAPMKVAPPPPPWENPGYATDSGHVTPEEVWQWVRDSGLTSLAVLTLRYGGFQSWMTLIAPHLLPSGGLGWPANDSLRLQPPNRVDAALFRTRSKSRREKENKVDDEGNEVKQ